MYKDKNIAVVIPAYNEEKYIAHTIYTIPYFVDHIYVVDDASTDNTYKIAARVSSQNGKLNVLHRKQNGGVGAAIITGHKIAMIDGSDVVAIMAGDGQMDPSILYKIIEPVVQGKADYAKGNRLTNHQHLKEMPAWRIFGNILLTYLEKMASGYWHISDPQNGYTAISARALRNLNLDKVEKGFAFENDILVKLNVIGAQVIDVPHPAIYHEQQSKIRYTSFIGRTSWLLIKDFLWRLYTEYFKQPSNHKVAEKVDID
jgi:glycosyltransferase involved in cell wall biosynthesis